MNRWPITIFQSATETERRHNVHSRAALPATVNRAMGWGILASNKETPLDLSIAKARGVSSRLSIFSISCLGEVLRKHRGEREKVVVGRATVSCSIELCACRTRIRLLIPDVPRTITVCVRPSRS
jgi:hypothetical protein